MFAICAGHFEEFRFDENELGIPFGIYIRKSLAQFLIKDDFFRWTFTALKYYSEYFKCPYPFDKMDYVIVSEYN